MSVVRYHAWQSVRPGFWCCANCSVVRWEVRTWLSEGYRFLFSQRRGRWTEKRPNCISMTRRAMAGSGRDAWGRKASR